ncbi:hypothetical protein [Rhodococcus opacus]|uniref:hypothetical protein n=1 Tax=Rhodococcus opacus TaxID=37919 RepID=UPI0027D2EE93|nr:hypothetical protein [Rhodococcus opacus]
MSLSVFADGARHDEQPLFTPIDRWGHTPYDPTPLTGHSIAALVRAHLAGSAPVHERPPAWQPPTKSGEDAPVPVVVDDVDLDQGYYDRGIAARRGAHTHLEDVTDILDGIEDEADKLLADLLAILDRTEID